MLSTRVLNLLAAILIAVLASSNVFAESSPKKSGEPSASFSVTPTAGIYLFAPQQHLDPALLTGFRVSYDIVGSSIVSSLGIEATVNYFTTKSQGTSADGYLFRGDARYLITPRDKVVPFLVLGMGDIVTRGEFGNSNSPLFNYGAGVQYFLEDWLALRVDARQLFVYRNVNTRNNFELSTGVTYLFGKEHKKKVEQAKLPTVPIPAIPDLVDQEPAQTETRSLGFYERLEVTGPAMGVSTTPPVFPTQAPPPVPVPTPRAFLRAATPAEAQRPAPVAPQAPAAPAGKPAALEPKPAATPAAAPETLEPNPEQIKQKEPQPARMAKPHSAPQPQPQQDQNLQMEISFVEIPEPPGKAPAQHRRKMLRRFTVEFDFGSYQIRPIYYKQIELLAAAIKASPESSVIIEAHTDFVGKKGANVVLSINRAKSLSEALVKQGVDRKTISIQGYGDSRPVADNRTEKGRQKNRRAVAVVTIVTIVPDQPPAPK